MPRPGRHSSPTRAAAFVCAVVMLGCGSLAAEERFFDFLHALQDQGYGQIAVEYLEAIRERPDLPEELRGTLDLEFAKSLQVAAVESVNPAVAAQNLVTAQTHLDKFLKDFPEHPEAATAVTLNGDIGMTRGQTELRQALALKDKAKQAAEMDRIRATFDAARPQYTRAAELYKQQLAELLAEEAAAETEKPKPGRPRRRNARADREAASEREEAEELWINARFKLASVDFNVAQTYVDAGAAPRKEALQKAALGFDAIYQEYRTLRPGLYAHMWHGRTLDQLGDLLTALDIYDEVLANAPERGDERPDPAFEALFAEVARFKLLIYAKQEKTDALIAEAQDWLEANAPMRRTPGYQGVALELARAQIALANKAEAAQKRKMMQEALVLLSAISKIPSEYQRDAILMHRQYAFQAEGGSLADIKSFVEALAIADSSASNAAWADAVAGYKRALELSADAKEPERVLQARLLLARSLFMSGQSAEAFTTADALAHEKPASPSAPAAAALAVTAALNLYVTSEDKPAALDRLRKAADYTLQKWPQRAEADDARIALGKLYLVQGNFPEAIKSFESVIAASDRYPAAMYFAAQTHWRLYVEEKRKSAAAAKSEAAQAHRAKAVEQLTASRTAERKELAPGLPLPRSLMDTELLLAEVQLEGGQAAEASGLLQPLVETVKAQPPESFDSFSLRVLVAAVRVYVAAQDLAKAGEVATILVEKGGDVPQVNAVLVDFGKLLKSQWKKAEITFAAVKAGTDKTVSESAAQTELTSTTALLTKLLEQLGSRQQQSLGGLVFVADTSAEMGLTEKARELYQTLLKRAEENPALVKGNEKAFTRIRAQLIGLLRGEKKYAEALQQADQLVKDNPNALEPMMEQGRILQALAESEPAKYADALNHWTRLRTMMARLQRKPPEYYEAIYNAAYCLVAQTAERPDKTKLTQAEQLLKSTRVLSPSLSGPDMVARYDALLKQIAAEK